MWKWETRDHQTLQHLTLLLLEHPLQEHGKSKLLKYHVDQIIDNQRAVYNITLSLQEHRCCGGGPRGSDPHPET